ncbi:MAG: hypothetical protein AAFP90_03945, partial [Planctomycetota bacterium]
VDNKATDIQFVKTTRMEHNRWMAERLIRGWRYNAKMEGRSQICRDTFVANGTFEKAMSEYKARKEKKKDHTQMITLLLFFGYTLKIDDDSKVKSLAAQRE